MADFHFLELFVLDFYRQIQNGFDSFSRLCLEFRCARVFVEHRATQTDVPFLIGLDAFAIKLRCGVIAGCFAVLDELFVLLQRE